MFHFTTMLNKTKLYCDEFGRKLPKEMGRLFSQLETMRENSDYNCVYEVSKAELADRLAPAKEMIDTIARMVKE